MKKHLIDITLVIATMTVALVGTACNSREVVHAEIITEEQTIVDLNTIVDYGINYDTEGNRCLYLIDVNGDMWIVE